MTILTRRSFGLGALGSALVAFATGAGPTTRRRFLFVHAEGGWDPLCAFAPMFDAPLIQMEPDAAPLTVGNFALVDGPGRPAVKEFFQRYGDRTLLVNGLSTRSINHENCQFVALTGSVGEGSPDWATLLAVAEQDRYYLPHLVLNGPALPGEHTLVVSYADGLLQDAVHGTLLEAIDDPLIVPSAGSRSLVDAYLASRASSFARPGAALGSSYHAAFGRARALTDAKELVHFTPVEDEGGLQGIAANAIRLLADGVARCATISTDFVWDTHEDNSLQPALFQALFTDLAAILDTLAATKTAEGTVLADETVVVVLSEMGRTPAYNDTQGRDHWPYTSALLIGPGITGGRAIGGYSDLFAGIGVDPASGSPDPSRLGIDSKSLGATLLALGDVDPAEHLPDAAVLTGVLS